MAAITHPPGLVMAGCHNLSPQLIPPDWPAGSVMAAITHPPGLVMAALTYPPGSVMAAITHPADGTVMPAIYYNR